MNLRCLLPLVLLLVSLPAAAQLPPREVSVSLGMWDTAELGNEPALGASHNYYWTPMLSTRAGGFIAKGDDVTSFNAHVSGELHLFRHTRVSPWVGAGLALAYTRLNTQDFSGSEMHPTGIYSGGVDVAVSPRFAIGAEASYMNYELELGSRFGYGVDSVTMLVSGRWRF